MRIDLLPVERWGELARALDESRSDESIPKPENSIILGAFEGDRIVGCVSDEKVHCVSCFWVDKEYRGRGLAQKLASALNDRVKDDLRAISITTSPHVEQIIFGLGFTPILGQAWRQEERHQQQN